MSAVPLVIALRHDCKDLTAYMERLAHEVGMKPFTFHTAAEAKSIAEMLKGCCLIVDTYIGASWRLLVQELAYARTPTLIVFSDDTRQAADSFIGQEGIVEAVHWDDKFIVQRIQGFLHLAASSRSSRGPKAPAMTGPTDIFIVHGLASSQKDRVEAILRSLHTDPRVLCDAPRTGLALIEHLEQVRAVAKLVLVVLTADDQCQSGDGQRWSQARANVLFEWGFFAGHIGRDRVVCLREDGSKLPSDLNGVFYLSLEDSDDKLREALARLLQDRGIPFRL